MKRLLLLILAVALASAAAASVSAVEAPSAGAASGGQVKRCGGGKIFLNAKEKTVFHKHNRVRRDNNLRTLCVHPKLQRAARAHSRDMIRRDYFAHGDVGQRLKNYGYNWRIYAENIAYGSGSKGSPGYIMRSWMQSSSHRTNILDGRFREIGIGTYAGTYKGYSNTTMYTADFGTR